MKIHIKNGRVIDPMNKRDEVTDLFIAAGKIIAIGQSPADFHVNRTIDASGLIVCPGLIDLSVRLREPGYEYRATLESEMLAAAAGGVTSLACPRHRPAAGRTRPGRNAEVPRQKSARSAASTRSAH